MLWKFKIVNSGKLKEKYLKDKLHIRTSRFAAVEMIELADDTRSCQGFTENEKILDLEGNRIFQNGDREFVTLWRMKGKKKTLF